MKVPLAPMEPMGRMESIEPGTARPIVAVVGLTFTSTWSADVPYSPYFMSRMGKLTKPLERCHSGKIA